MFHSTRNHVMLNRWMREIYALNDGKQPAQEGRGWQGVPGTRLSKWDGFSVKNKSSKFEKQKGQFLGAKPWRNLWQSVSCKTRLKKASKLWDHGGGWRFHCRNWVAKSTLWLDNIYTAILDCRRHEVKSNQEVWYLLNPIGDYWNSTCKILCYPKRGRDLRGDKSIYGGKLCKKWSCILCWGWTRRRNMGNC